MSCFHNGGWNTEELFMCVICAEDGFCHEELQHTGRRIYLESLCVPESIWCLKDWWAWQQGLWLIRLSIRRTLELIGFCDQVRMHLLPLVWRGYLWHASQSGLINGCTRGAMSDFVTHWWPTYILLLFIIQISNVGCFSKDLAIISTGKQPHFLRYYQHKTATYSMHHLLKGGPMR